MVPKFLSRFPVSPRVLVILGSHRGPQRGPWARWAPTPVLERPVGTWLPGWVPLGPRPQPAQLPDPVPAQKAHLVFVGWQACVHVCEECARARSPRPWPGGMHSASGSGNTGAEATEAPVLPRPLQGSLTLGSADGAVGTRKAPQAPHLAAGQERRSSWGHTPWPVWHPPHEIPGGEKAAPVTPASASFYLGGAPPGTD